MLTLDYLIFVFVGKLNGFNKREKRHNKTEYWEKRLKDAAKLGLFLI